LSSFQAGLCDLAIIGALTLMGWALLRALGVERDRLAMLSLGMALGGGLFTWMLFILSWSGIGLTAPALVFSYGALLLGLLALGRARGRPEGAPADPGASPGTVRSPFGRMPEIGLSALVVVLVVAAIVLAVGLSYYTWDAIATWSVGGYGIALEGSIFAPARWGAADLNYPLNVQLLIGTFRILDGDVLPGSKLLFPLFYASLLLGCYRFLRKQHVERSLALLGIVLIGSTPLIFTHATMGYTNLPMAHYLVMGLLWGIEAVSERSSRKALVAGFLVALAGWTRPEGIILGLAIPLSLLGGALVAHEKPKPIAALLLPWLATAAAWGIFHSQYATGEVEAIADARLALQGISQGVFHWAAFYTIARYFAGQILRFREWGLFFPAVVFLLAAGLRPRRLSRNFRSLALAIGAGLVGILVVGAHYIAAYSGHGPGFVYDWLALEFNRVFMPVGLTVALLSIVEFSDRLRSRPSRNSMASRGGA
jgi:hypothetical protein